MISRCSSPIPAMIVCPVSSSVFTRNEGSSMASFCSATPSLSWSSVLFGSSASSITGVGEVDLLQQRSGALGTHSVSPVTTFFRPTMAQMSPA